MTFQCVCLIMALVSRAVIHNNLRFAILAELCEDIVGDQVKALNKVNEVRALVRCAFGDVPYSMKQKSQHIHQRSEHQQESRSVYVGGDGGHGWSL